MANAFDGAAILGDFITPEKVLTDPFVVTVNGELYLQCIRGLLFILIENMIEYVSRYFTLKIGDLILIEDGEWHDAEINSRVTARLGDFESINIKIK